MTTTTLLSTIYIPAGKGKYHAVQLYCAGCGHELYSERVIPDPSPMVGCNKDWPHHTLECPQCGMMLSGEDAVIEWDAALIEVGL